MEFLEIIEKELLYAKAKVEVLEDLKSKYAFVNEPPQADTTEFTDFADETQSATDNTY